MIKNLILSVFLLFFEFLGFDALLVVFHVKVFKFFEKENSVLVWVDFNEQVTDHIIFQAQIKEVTEAHVKIFESQETDLVCIKFLERFLNAHSPLNFALDATKGF